MKAIRTVLAAYRSTEAVITEEQITAAWAEYDALVRACTVGTAWPRVCPDCRVPILTPAAPHRCERLVCPECLGMLSRKGFCAACLIRYEMPTVDPLDRLAELEAYFDAQREADHA